MSAARGALGTTDDHIIRRQVDGRSQPAQVRQPQ